MQLTEMVDCAVVVSKFQCSNVHKQRGAEENDDLVCIKMKN